MTDPILIIGVAIVAALVAALVACALLLGYCQSRIARPLREMERHQEGSLVQLIGIGGRVDAIHAILAREEPEAPGTAGDGGMIGG